MKTQLKELEDGRVKIQVGKVLTTFKVNDDGKVTTFDKDGAIKEYRFENSSIEVLYSVAILLLEVAKVARKDNPREELQIGKYTYKLVMEAK